MDPTADFDAMEEKRRLKEYCERIRSQVRKLGSRIQTPTFVFMLSRGERTQGREKNGKSDLKIP